LKKLLITAAVLCLAFSLCAETVLAAETGIAAITGELLPVDIVQYSDRLEIRKVYELSPTLDPGRLPRESFERGSVTYECVDILREVVIGEESKTVTESMTVESKKKDMDTILGLLPQFKDAENSDGFTGALLLNTGTIKSEVSGYGSSTTPYTVTRSYPNLSNADSQYIPKTIEDNGKTLQLKDVQWQTDNTMNVDDYEIGDRYTAIAAYEGTKTSSYATGYTITADYTGEVFRKGVTLIRYTVIFAGTEIPAPEPTAQPAIDPNAPDKPESEAKSGFGWITIPLSALALLGSGGCLYFIIKNKKETSHNEENSTNNYTDADFGALDNASGESGVNV
jgi:hypothetical protein